MNKKKKLKNIHSSLTLINLIIEFTTLKSMENEKEKNTPHISSHTQNFVWIKSQIKIQID